MGSSLRCLPPYLASALLFLVVANMLDAYRDMAQNSFRIVKLLEQQFRQQHAKADPPANFGETEVVDRRQKIQRNRPPADKTEEQAGDWLND